MEMGSEKKNKFISFDLWPIKKVKDAVFVQSRNCSANGKINSAGCAPLDPEFHLYSSQ